MNSSTVAVLRAEVRKSCTANGFAPAQYGTKPQATILLNGVTYSVIIPSRTQPKKILAIESSSPSSFGSDYLLILSADDAGYRLAARAVLTKSANEQHLPATASRVSPQLPFNRAFPLSSDGSSNYADFYFAETRSPWIPYSVKAGSAKTATLAVRSPARCVVLPGDTKLTLRVLIGALCKFPTPAIEDVVEMLIDVLDCRHGDCDLEIDVESEPDVIELSDQVV